MPEIMCSFICIFVWEAGPQFSFDFHKVIIRLKEKRVRNHCPEQYTIAVSVEERRRHFRKEHEHLKSRQTFSRQQLQFPLLSRDF